MDTTSKILTLLDNSPSCFHAIENIADSFLEKGYTELFEEKEWELEKGKGYFVRRNMSSIIAFFIPDNPRKGFKVVASHSDSPTFKIKPNPIMDKAGYKVLDVEPYGGAIYRSFLDRPLSLAGRILVKKGNRIESRLFNVDEDLLSIPSVCIHFDREVNNGKPLVPGVDLNPLFSSSCNDFNAFVSSKAGLKEGEELISHDLFLYTREKARLFGAEKEFVSSPRLDNLESAYATMLGFINGKKSDMVSIYCCFDNEEVGSLTRQGARGTFLKDVLNRISAYLGSSAEIMASNGFFLSVDNGHAIHPNHPELSSPTSPVKLNEGIIIKSNASQSYTSDGLSSSLVKVICQQIGVPFQEFVNRSDIRGGGTLGNLSNGQVSFLSCDIGLAQLAMHSAVECAGSKDIEYMARLIEGYYSTPFKIDGTSIVFE